MRKIFLLIFLFIGSISFSQEFVYDSVWTFKLRVYNPLDQSLNLIIKNKLPEDGELKTRFVTLAPKDTTEFPFILSTAMDRVPEYDFEFKIYEAPSYYRINSHYSWNCKRIVDDNYSCWNSIEAHIRVEDSLKFNKEDYLRKEIENAPIYEDYVLKTKASYKGGLMDLIGGARDFILADSADIDVSMYVKFVVEIDGSISNFEFIKPTTEKYNKKIEAYFKDKNFAPAYRRNLKVRSTLALPIKVEYLRD